MNLKHQFLYTIVCLGIAGCASQAEHPWSGPAPVTERTKADPATGSTTPTVPWSTGVFDRERHADDELLIYAKHFEELSADNQKKELAQVLQSLSRNKRDSYSRLKAVLIYSLPNSRLRDNTKALVYIADLQRDKPPEDDINALVSMLKSFVDDRQRQDENYAKLNQRLRDEQRRGDDLQTKLDALKNIDKTMIERGQGTTK